MTADPVGTVEIAARLAVARSTVDQWRQRSLGFPEPRWTVGGRPAWNWLDVEAWAVQTERLPNEPLASRAARVFDLSSSRQHEDP
jgi:predicted DNA-binding transcriptional regulator AlpA